VVEKSRRALSRPIFRALLPAQKPPGEVVSFFRIIFLGRKLTIFHGIYML